MKNCNFIRGIYIHTNWWYNFQHDWFSKPSFLLYKNIQSLKCPSSRSSSEREEWEIRMIGVDSDSLNGKWIPWNQIFTHSYNYIIDFFSSIFSKKKIWRFDKFQKFLHKEFFYDYYTSPKCVCMWRFNWQLINIFHS